MTSADRSTVAILGCGLIGASWAALFLHHGFDVRAWDPDKAARDSFAEKVAPRMAQLRRLSEPRPNGGPTLCNDLASALAGAALVQENAPESIATKLALLREVEELAPPAACIASSTSALRWRDLAPGLSDPTRLITAHPFNPPHLVPLVETYGIDPDVLDRAEAVYRACDRVPVRLQKDATGHIANRLASALWREAVNIVAEGIADVAAVDAALVNGPGLRWSVLGAHMAYHLGGGPGGLAGYLAHLGPSQERRWASLGTPSLTPELCAELVDGVHAEAAGRSIPELESQRDEALIAALLARKAAPHV